MLTVDRKADRRTAEEEGALELFVYDEETDRFVARAYRDSRRAFELINGGLILEAHRTLADFHAAAGRRAAQRRINPDDPRWGGEAA